MDQSALTPHEIEQQRLMTLAELILPLERKLRGLPKDHIEEPVIWLKNIHNPSDPEDRNTDAWLPFYNRVGELKNVPEQIDLQSKAVKALRSAIYTGIVIGGLLIAALWGGGCKRAVRFVGAVGRCAALVAQGFKVCLEVYSGIQRAGAEEPMDCYT